MECYRMSWEESERLIGKVVKRIWKSGFSPDVIVAIIRGGLVPARVIADRMALKDLITIKMEHWGTAVPLKEAKITQGVGNGAAVAGKKVLVVDDLTDTGESLEKAAEYIRKFGASEVRTAVVEHKSSSKFVPDYYARELDRWKWIIYPWELHEDMIRFVGDVVGDGSTMGDMRARLAEKYGLYIGNYQLAGILKDMEYKGLLSSQERGGKTYWVKA